MTNIKGARDEVLVALRTVKGVRVYQALTADMQTPAVVIGIPSLAFTRGTPEIGTLEVYLLIQADTPSDSLYDYAEQIAVVVEEEVPGAEVSSADFQIIEVGGKDYPAYRFEILINLGG